MSLMQHSEFSNARVGKLDPNPVRNYNNVDVLHDWKFDGLTGVYFGIK